MAKKHEESYDYLIEQKFETQLQSLQSYSQLLQNCAEAFRPIVETLVFAGQSMAEDFQTLGDIFITAVNDVNENMKCQMAQLQEGDNSARTKKHRTKKHRTKKH